MSACAVVDVWWHRPKSYEPIITLVLKKIKIILQEYSYLFQSLIDNFIKSSARILISIQTSTTAFSVFSGRNPENSYIIYLNSRPYFSIIA